MTAKLLNEQELARQLASFLMKENKVRENQEKLHDLKANRPAFENEDLSWQDLKETSEHECTITDLELLIARQHEQIEILEKEIAAIIPNNIYGKNIVINHQDHQGNIINTYKLTVISSQEIDVVLSQSESPDTE